LTKASFADDLIEKMANGMKSMIAHQISEDIKHFSNKMIEKKRKGGLQGIGSESGSINTSGSVG